MKKTILLFVLSLLIVSGTACTKQSDSPQAVDSEVTTHFSSETETWLQNANLSAEEAPEDLYRKALYEDTLIIYSN